MSHELSFSGGRRIVLGGDREPDSMPVVMGIVNVTPDSFSDGGRYLDPTRAVDQALRLIDQGAEIVDLGAESTRPGGGVYGAGMNEISAHDELNRLLPVLEALRPRTDAAISIDTRKGEVAREVLHAGADLINDVGGLGDSELAEVVAESGCPVVIMHSRGELSSMQRDIRFDDVVREVEDELRHRVQIAKTAGIDADRIILDPGIGFGKTTEQNVMLLAATGRLAATGFPILIGASRKSFIAGIAEDASSPVDRLGGSLAAAAWSSRLGAAILRVHDVAATMQFLRISHAIDSAR